MAQKQIWLWGKNNPFEAEGMSMRITQCEEIEEGRRRNDEQNIRDLQITTYSYW